MNCLDCAIYGTCEQPCDEVESQLPGPYSGGLPGQTIQMDEKMLEVVAHHEGVDWEELTPMKRLFHEGEIDILLDYRFTEAQRKLIYYRFFLDYSWKETRIALGGTSKSSGMSTYMRDIKAKIVNSHAKWSIWEQLKDFDWQIQYESLFNRKAPDVCGGLKLRSVAFLQYKKLLSQTEIATELGVNLTTIKVRCKKVLEIMKKNDIHVNQMVGELI